MYNLLIVKIQPVLEPPPWSAVLTCFFYAVTVYQDACFLENHVDFYFTLWLSATTYTM